MKSVDEEKVKLLNSHIMDKINVSHRVKSEREKQILCVFMRVKLLQSHPTFYDPRL